MKEWNPESIRLNEVKVSSNPRISKNISIINGNGLYAYAYPNEDQSILHSIDPSLIELNERLIASTTKSVPHDSNKQTPRMTMISYERHNKITTNQLAERLGIGLKRAEATLRVTTQRGTRSSILPISRQYRADRVFNHKRLSEQITKT